MASINDYRTMNPADPMAGFRLATPGGASPWAQTPDSSAWMTDPNAPLPYANMTATTPDLSSISNPGGGGFMSGLQGWLKDTGFLTTKDADGMQTQGWGGLALGAAQGLGNLYMGMQQYNVAKDTLANNKAQFERNFAAQKATTNASLEDRQRARVASNAGAYQSVGDYMNQNGVR